LWDAWDDAEFLEKTGRDVDSLKSEIWLPFEHRAKVLHHFGYLDFPAQKVTKRGKWLADLRVDRPLLVGEALAARAFRKLETKQVAGLMAALAADSDRNYGELYLSDEILEVLTKFEDIIFDVSNVEWKNGIEPVPEMNFSRRRQPNGGRTVSLERFGFSDKSRRRRFGQAFVTHRRSVDASRALKGRTRRSRRSCRGDGRELFCASQFVSSFLTTTLTDKRQLILLSFFRG
jgi:hypothetical protein